MQLSTPGAPQLARDEKQVAPAGARRPGMVVAATRSRPLLLSSPASTPMNWPGEGAARKPEPSGDTSEAPDGVLTVRLPKPTAHHVADTGPEPAGAGANQLPLAHCRTAYGPSF